MDANNQSDAKNAVVKAALVQMTACQGWSYVKQLANNLVQRAVTDALEEEDSDKGEQKRLKAQALRKGFHDWFIAIEAWKQFTTEDDSSLNELEME